MEKKKEIDLVAVQPRKANAQRLTCYAAFLATAMIAFIMMLVACLLPISISVTEDVCYASMTLEAASVGLGFVAYWIKRNAL